jgi:hypothetical protein
VGATLQEPNVWATLTEHDSVVFNDNDFEIFVVSVLVGWVVFVAHFSPLVVRLITPSSIHHHHCNQQIYHRMPTQQRTSIKSLK